MLRRFRQAPLVLAFEIAGFALEVFGGAQPRVPDRGVFGALGKFTIPAREIAQLLCLVHVLRFLRYISVIGTPGIRPGSWVTARLGRFIFHRRRWRSSHARRRSASP